MLTTTYSGQFRSLTADLWKFDILETRDKAVETPTTIQFDADQPITLEWEDIDIYKPIQGCTLTAKIFSDTDREFIHLAALAQTSCLCRLSLNGNLFWCGCIDTETYEEPYQLLTGYVVTLTFTDFGVWKNQYALVPSRFIDIDTYLHNAFNLFTPTDYPLHNQFTLSAVSGKDLDTFPAADEYTPLSSLQSVHIDAHNFLSDDDAPCSLYDAIEAILQPLSLRLVQRNGCIYLYDLYTISQSESHTPISWQDDEQTLSFDSAYNKFTIKHSPNGKSQILKYELPDEVFTSTVNKYLNVKSQIVYSQYNLPYRSDKNYKEYPSFNFLWCKNQPDITGITISSRARLFKIVPLIGGAQESTGIAWNAILNACPNNYFKAWSGDGLTDKETPIGIDNRNNGYYSYPDYDNEILILSAWCGASSSYVKNNTNDVTSAYNLCLKLPILIDPRYNPFEEAGEINSGSSYNAVRDIFKVLYIPYTLTLQTKDKTYYLAGQYTKEKEGTTTIYSYKKWWSTTRPTNSLRLFYYQDGNTASYQDGGAVTGWQTNKDRNRFTAYADNRNTGTTYSKIYISEGEQIPLPPEPGTLTLTIEQGILNYSGFSDEDPCDPDKPASPKAQSSLLRYILYQFPTIDIIYGAQAATDDTPDNTYTLTTDNPSHEELSIDTTFGTDTALSPKQKGVYRSSTGERILLRSLNALPEIEYSLLYLLSQQYTTRSLTLKGECLMPTPHPATAHLVSLSEAQTPATTTNTTPTPPPLTPFTDPSTHASLFFPRYELLTPHTSTSQTTFFTLNLS